MTLASLQVVTQSPQPLPAAGSGQISNEQFVQRVENATCTYEDFKNISNRQIDRLNHNVSLRRRLRIALDKHLNSGHTSVVLLIANLCLGRNIRYEHTEEELRESTKEELRVFSKRELVLVSILKAGISKGLKDDCAKLLVKAVENGFPLHLEKNELRELVLLGLKNGYFDEKNENVQTFLSTEIEKYSNPEQLYMETPDDSKRRVKLSHEITSEILKRKTPLKRFSAIDLVLFNLQRSEHSDLVRSGIILLNSSWDYASMPGRESSIGPQSAHRLNQAVISKKLLPSGGEKFAGIVVKNACNTLDRFKLSKRISDSSNVLEVETFKKLVENLKQLTYLSGADQISKKALACGFTLNV